MNDENNPIIEKTSEKVSDVDIKLAKQRNQSDARSIINEVERLNSFEGFHRFRWIWELLQNARDESQGQVDIVCEISNNRFYFRHNGQPFYTEHLLALTRKTSTKPIDGSKGNAGKFGTGFITSHLLNKIVKISGVFANSKGRRRFTFELNRTWIGLEQMQKSIADNFQDIRDIDILPAEVDLTDNWNCFEYKLGTVGLEIAKGGIEQLEENLAFTLLVNDQIKSLTIIENENKRCYTVEKDDSGIEGVSFIQLANDKEVENEKGLLYMEKEELIIANPVEKVGENYSLLPIGLKAHIYKELPLIGTEEFYLPCIIQHEDFQPTEPRDGIRTKIASDLSEDDDPKGKKNRSALRDFVKSFPIYIEKLVKNGVSNLHLLAESGLPPNVDAYYGKKWLQVEVQKELRSVILTHDLVQTVSGGPVSVSNAVFPACEPEHLELIYGLVSQLYPSKCPNSDSYGDWVRIINQELETWSENITINIEELVTKINEEEALLAQFETEPNKIAWIQSLVLYLEESGNERLGKEKPVYPNQKGNLKIESEVFHDMGVDPQFKKISAGLGRVLEEELLPINFKAKFVSNFDIKEFLNNLNLTIGKLAIPDATPENIQAILNVCSSFKATKASKRELWFDLLKELLPTQVNTKTIVSLEEEYMWGTAEKWALKYVCSLIREAVNLDQFFTLYFEGNEANGFIWLNKFYGFVFRNDDNIEIGLRYNIVPTQDGVFRDYDDNLHKEDVEFDERIKELYEEYTGKGDPKEFLIHNSVEHLYFRETSLTTLTRTIDDLFNTAESEELVKDKGEYHQLFLALKDWVEEREDAANYFPIFTKKQPILYIKAFGAGSSLGRLLKLKKSVDDIEKLDKLKLSPEQLKKIDDAVQVIGNAESLIQKANEMAELADEIRWRKAVGTAAEDAFIEALKEAAPSFPKPDNPDIGKDFVIRIGGKEFSIELKSAIEKKETVKMSIRQGETAVLEKDSYALCVISRPSGQLTNKVQFIERAKFVVTIGTLIGDKIDKWHSGLTSLDDGQDVSVKLENKSGGVYINRPIWNQEKSFKDFITFIKDYFNIV